MLTGGGDLGDAAYALDNMADLLLCLTCACCLAQIHRELDVRDGRRPADPSKVVVVGAPAGAPYVAPPVQQQGML